MNPRTQEHLPLKQRLHTRPHSPRIKLPPQPRPLQRQTPHLQIPRIRTHNRSRQLTPLSLLPQILKHTTRTSENPSP